VNTKPSRDTSLGGDGDRFPETGGDIRSLLGQDPSRLELLCRRYWKPVYAYVRIAWSKGNEDAKDLTQAFFLWLMEGETLARYDAEKGGFRAYLKTLLKRFVGHEERALQRLKRGGDARIVFRHARPAEQPGGARVARLRVDLHAASKLVTTVAGAPATSTALPAAKWLRCT